MKAEIIAEWRLRIKDRTLITLPVSAIERILEERQQLLDALKAVEWRGESGFWEAGGCPDCLAEELRNWERGDHHEPSCKLRAAIAYAESEGDRS